MHHLYFKKTSRRTLWATAHVWLGRILITLAMINGGFGLQLSAPYINARPGYIVYGVFAGLIWCIYVAAAVYGEVRGARGAQSGADRAKSGFDSDRSDEKAAHAA